jgi:hypothetical protein
VQLPTQAPLAGKWQLWDYRVKRLRTPVADSNGQMLVSLDQVPSDELWLVDRMRVSSDSVRRPEVTLYENDTEPNSVIDWTPAGRLDIADNSAPILLPAGTVLVIEWTGATPLSAVGYARVQWTILRPNQVTN